MMIAVVTLNVRKRSNASGGTGSIITNSIPTIPTGSMRSALFFHSDMFMRPAISFYLSPRPVFEPVDVCQDLCDCLVEGRWYLRAYLDALVQAPCQGLVLKHRHIVLSRYFPYLLSYEARALGNDYGRVGLGPVVPDGDRKVRRVGEDDICLGDLLHHPLPCHVPLHGPYPGLDEGVSLGLLHLLFYLFLAHPEALLEVPPLEGVVYDRYGGDDPDRPDHYLEGDARDVHGRGRGVHLDKERHVLPFLLHAAVDDVGEDRDLEYGFDELCERVDREELLYARERVYLVEVGAQGLCREVKPVLQHVRERAEGRYHERGRDYHEEAP